MPSMQQSAEVCGLLGRLNCGNTCNIVCLKAVKCASSSAAAWRDFQDVRCVSAGMWNILECECAFAAKIGSLVDVVFDMQQVQQYIEGRAMTLALYLKQDSTARQC
jgi:hypothetical protein